MCWESTNSRFLWFLFGQSLRLFFEPVTDYSHLASAVLVMSPSCCTFQFSVTRIIKALFESPGNCLLFPGFFQIGNPSGEFIVVAHGLPFLAHKSQYRISHISCQQTKPAIARNNVVARQNQQYGQRTEYQCNGDLVERCMDGVDSSCNANNSQTIK